MKRTSVQDSKPKIQSANWRARLKKNGIHVPEPKLTSFSWDDMKKIAGRWWGQILETAKEKGGEVTNIVAITAKETRKTFFVASFLWFLMHEYPWLNAYALRDTLTRSQSQTKQQIRDSARIIQEEYGVDGFAKYVAEISSNFYLVRDKNSKSNQGIETASFDGMVQVGGFNTGNGQPALFLYDELQNPDSAKTFIPDIKKFLSNYKFVATKAKNKEIMTGNKLPKGIPRHFFMSNRYVSLHPLNQFAEAHYPFYDTLVEGSNVRKPGVKSGFLEDLYKNVFAFSYIGKDDVREEWKDFKNTIIVYATSFSNDRLLADDDTRIEMTALVERGYPEDLARIIGDCFEGYDNNVKCYHYTKKSIIKRADFIKDFAPHVFRIRISVDLDFHRQIVFGAAYDVCKTIINPVDNKKHTIWRVVRDKIVAKTCSGPGIDGGRTELYLRRLYDDLKEYVKQIRKEIPGFKDSIQLILDDASGSTPGRFNYSDYGSEEWDAIKVTFDRLGPIKNRPRVIDEMQDTGFVIDIEDPSLDQLHDYLNVAMNKPEKEKGKSQRLERSGDFSIDGINMDEYRLFHSWTLLNLNNYATQDLGGNNVG